MLLASFSCRLHDGSSSPAAVLLLQPEAMRRSSNVLADPACVPDDGMSVVHGQGANRGKCVHLQVSMLIAVLDYTMSTGVMVQHSWVSLFNI